ncbi:nicotinate-nucleotide adenylyltransferase [Aliamphritea hakodatensis]|uniref:nicotinate-nucleotide adenylyltransferase n=1 Tax=Aliamphritea hakodatensis TaxID=2895352 RepID=UPI0022FD3D08|nr:nicotinate-nucleotide adenylyltransferase [Aliamphritea hakodatensis]
MSNTVKPAVCAFMGGTFDPIHNGHLRTALEIRDWLNADQVALMPSKVPVHRQQPGAGSEQRLAMVEQAVAAEPGLYADAREVSSEKPSYTVLTLESLRAELGADVPVCMILGMDAYLSLPGWDRWQELIRLAHIVVVKRPGWVYQPGEQMKAFTRVHEVTDKQKILTEPAGHVIFHELTPLAISATQIRTLVSEGHSPRYLLPDSVWQYIQQQQLYGCKSK